MIRKLNPVSAFEAEIQDGASILTDGGTETRIMFETDVPLPPHVQVATLVKDPTGGPYYAESIRATSTPPARSVCR